MLFSKEAGYAIRALIKLAEKPRDQFISAKTLAQELQISESFLSKILQKLVKQGWLQSVRGAKGGVSYAIDPEALSLLDVVLAVDGDTLFTKCILGLPECPSRNGPCVIHQEWAPLRDALWDLLKKRTIADFSRTR